MNAGTPDASLLEEIETHAVAIARGVGKILLDYFGKPLEVKFKGKNKRDPVTTADGLSDAYLKQAIREKFPDHNILSEEGGAEGRTDSPFTWVLDPLDGTSNYMNGLPIFASSIGVLWNRLPVVGSIYVPISHLANEGVYHARLDNGAYFNDEKIEIAGESEGRPLAAAPTVFFRISGKNLKQPHESRSLGSMAVEFAFTACGIFRYTFFSRPKLWDVAAGVILTKEAGGLSLVKRKGRGNWLDLEEFQPGPNDNREEMEKLYDWCYPVCAGVPETVRKVVKDIRRPRLINWRAVMPWPRNRMGKLSAAPPGKPPSPVDPNISQGKVN